MINYVVISLCTKVIWLFSQEKALISKYVYCRVKGHTPVVAVLSAVNGKSLGVWLLAQTAQEVLDVLFLCGGQSIKKHGGGGVSEQKYNWKLFSKGEIVSEEEVVHTCTVHYMSSDSLDKHF